MKYQLKTGIFIDIPSELYFSLSDEELQDLLADNEGLYYNDPFFDSVIKKGEVAIEEIEDEMSLPSNYRIHYSDMFNEE